VKNDAVIIEGRAYSWRALCELRKAQMDARRAARGSQPALFELKEDRRPSSERTAAGRYHEPTLLDWPTLTDSAASPSGAKREPVTNVSKNVKRGSQKKSNDCFVIRQPHAAE
jgi:hypothetical protein